MEQSSPTSPGPAGSNVVLTGFMGTGKTAVGRLLADRLQYEFVDTDAIIQERHGPIPEIFREHGEGEFRRLEREVAAELAALSGLVISTGGRLMVDAVNAARLEATGTVFCLTASVDTILDRVSGDDATVERPLLAGTDVRRRVTELLDERRPAYARFEQVETEQREPNEVVDDLLSRLLEQQP
jgi:shikimate kinase